MKRYYPNKKLKLSLITISILVFFAALSQPAFYVTNSSSPTWNSVAAFLFGWLGVAIPGAGITWLANPCLIFAWFIMLQRPKVAAISSFIAILFAILFLAFTKIIINEAGGEGKITGYALGYYLWLSSMAICFTGSAGIVLYEKGNANQIKLQ